MPEQPGAGRLDPETLAAYVDGLLPPEERARVEAEIAADPDTYEWMVNAVNAVEDVSIPAAVGVTPIPATPGSGRIATFRPRRPVIAGVGAVLAVAAALLLVVRLQPEWYRRLRGSHVDSRMAKLVEAVGEERYIEARLTGGFRFGPLRQALRGTSELSQQNLQLLAAAGELQKAATSDPTAGNLHAWGVAQLLLGALDDSVRTLQQSVDLNPGPDALADLAAALTTRAQRLKHPEDWPRALDAVAAALGHDPVHPGALFTKGLVLEGMNLPERAVDAWQAFIRAEASGPWADAAREHLANLAATSSPGPTGPSGADASALLRRMSLCADASSNPEALKADALAYARVVRDDFVRDLSAQQDWCTSRWSRVLGALGDAQRLLSEDRGHQADAALASLRRDEPGWPTQWLPQRALFTHLDNRWSFAARRYDVKELPGGERYPLLDGQNRHLDALVHFIRGDVPGSLRAYRAAVDRLRPHGFTDDYARALIEMAEVLDTLGQTDRAWDLIGEVSDHVARTSSTSLRAAFFGSMEDLMSAQGHAAAAAEYATAAATLLPRMSPAAQIAAHLSMSRTLARAGLSDTALTHVDAGLGLLDSVTDARHASLEAEALAQHGRALMAAGQPAAALQELQRALALTGGDRAEQAIERHALAATAATAVGDDALADDHFRQALGVLRGRRRGITLYSRASSFRDLRQAGYALAERRALAGDCAGAATFVLALRDDELSRGSEDSLRQSLARSESLPPDVLVVLHAKLPSRLIAWTLERGRVSCIPVSHTVVAALEQLPNALDRHSIDRVRAVLRSAGDLMPAGAATRGVGTIVVMPDATTMALPYPAIAWALGLSSRVVCLSPTLEAAPQQRLSTPRQVLAIGNADTGYGDVLPPLRRVPEELSAVAATYPSATIRQAPELSVQRLSETSSGYDVIHVAAHSVAGADPRLDARLLLGADDEGQLTGADIRRLGFGRGATVVLSACATVARGSDRAEPLSLAFAFVLAGARAVIGVSQPIGDDDAYWLALQAHRQLAAGTPPDEVPVRLLRDTAATGDMKRFWLVADLSVVTGVPSEPLEGRRSHDQH